MTATRQVTTWDDLYSSALTRLANRREARWMVEEVAGAPLGRISGGAPVGAELRLDEMVLRRQQGEPLQYVLGSWSFRRLELMVDRRVLIPRPETEEVVEVALAELDRLRERRPGRLTAVDLGTGSGAIALSLAAERPGVDVWATDASGEALAVARANLAGLAGHAATRVRMVEGDWWAALPADLRGRVDLMVSNPPYISSAEMGGLDPQVKEWEPRWALEAGAEGTEALELIVAGAVEWLAPEATMVLEMAPHQADAILRMADRSGFSEVHVRPDLAGRPRALVARR